MSLPPPPVLVILAPRSCSATSTPASLAEIAPTSLEAKHHPGEQTLAGDSLLALLGATSLWIHSTSHTAEDPHLDPLQRGHGATGLHRFHRGTDYSLVKLSLSLPLTSLRAGLSSQTPRPPVCPRGSALFRHATCPPSLPPCVSFRTLARSPGRSRVFVCVISSFRVFFWVPFWLWVLGAVLLVFSVGLCVRFGVFL